MVTPICILVVLAVVLRKVKTIEEEDLCDLLKF